jgi:hypothetical protein
MEETVRLRRITRKASLVSNSFFFYKTGGLRTGTPARE